MEAERLVGSVGGRQSGVEEQLAILAVPREDQALPHPTNTLPLGTLHVAGRIGVQFVGVGVLADQRGAHLLLVELQHDAAGLFYGLRPATVKDRGAVVEDGYRSVWLAPGVVLEGKSGAWTHLEVALPPPRGAT